jgi:murein DD-endopeptidase MepM/ murein hydrolase activator NlpD
MPIGLQQVAALSQKAGGSIERMVLIGARQLSRRAPFIVANLIVAAIVMALPFLASAAGRPAAQASVFSAAVASSSLAPVDGEPFVARAQSVARGGTIAAGRNPMTVQTDAVGPVQDYTLSKSDSLWSIANYYGLTAEAIAFSNGITDPYHLEVGKQIVIPPQQGALYTVADGDTIESVATRFKVEPSVIKDFNRLDSEPQHFSPGQTVFVANAALPTLPAPAQTASVASVISRPAPASAAAKADGYLSWPVSGVITQYMWAGHTGVDIAAPYGSGLASSINGVISENGWVAVGGLHICVKSGNLEECYFHMSAAYEPVGTAVKAGDVIGAIGLTGVTTGPHVHWETKVDGRLVNPLTVQP